MSDHTDNQDLIMPEDALDKINEIKEELDAIDQVIMGEVRKRMEVGSEIYRYKAALGLPVADPVRDVLKVSRAKNGSDDDASLAQAAVQRAVLRSNRHMQFRQNMQEDDSWLLGKELHLALQTKKKADKSSKRVGILTAGIPDYTEAVAKLYPEATVVPQRTIDVALDSLKQEAVDFVLLPIDNPLVGTITDLAKTIKRRGVHIIDDVSIPQTLRFLVNPGVKLGTIRRVVGTAEHLAEAHGLIKKMGWRSEEVAHAGIGISMMRDLNDPTTAVLASLAEGETYQLEEVETELSKTNGHYTRYLALANGPSYTDAANCMSLIVRLTHQSGALVEVLSCFADGNINLRQVHSMNVEGKAWEYEVYLEVIGKPDNDRLLGVLYEMDRSEDKDLQFLGWYEARDTRK